MKPDVLIKNAGKKGFGVFAAKPFKRGDLVVCGRSEAILEERTNYSFQVDLNEHAELDEPARLINHSCEPNLGIRNNKLGGYDFVVRRDICEGEELTWDYSMTEFISIAVRDRCLCGARQCRNIIRGFVCLPIETRNKYNDFIADYLKRL